MKHTIGGKLYNTDTARLICETGNGEYSTDFAFEASDLYVTKKGAYFIAGWGGPLSRFSVSEGRRETCGGEGIIPLSRASAFAEAQRVAGQDPDLLAKYFGDLIEDA